MTILMKYWEWLLAVIVLIALVAAVIMFGNGRYDAGYKAAYAEVSARLAESAKQQAKQAQQASHEYQTAKAENEQKERIRYVEVQKIVERPVYVQHCVDDDGLRELNAAIADGN